MPASMLEIQPGKPLPCGRSYKTDVFSTKKPTQYTTYYIYCDLPLAHRGKHMIHLDGKEIEMGT